MIVFSGYYGFLNFGDDLFPFACRKGAEEIWGEEKVFFLTPPQVGLEGHSLVPAWLGFLYRSRKLGRTVRALFLFYAGFRADTFILAGGSTLGSHTSMRLRQVEYFFSKIGIFNLCAIGVSVGPFDSQKDLEFFSRYLSKLKYLAVRDDASAKRVSELADNLKFTKTVDLVGLLRNDILAIQRSQIPSSALTVGISICKYKVFNEQESSIPIARAKALRNAIFQLGKTLNCRFLVMSLNGNHYNGDDEISLQLHREILQEGLKSEFKPYSSPWDVIADIKSVSCFLTFRLHGAIAAYLAEVPFVLVEYHDKCGDFLDTIGCSNSTRVTDSTNAIDYVKAVNNALSPRGGDYSMLPSEYESIARDTFYNAPKGIR